MNKTEFLQIRDCRRMIINICCNIYDNYLHKIDNLWDELIKKDCLYKIGENGNKIIQEAELCRIKKNWIRFRDLLLYLENILHDYLKTKFFIRQSWQDYIRAKNYEILRERDTKIMDLLENSVDMSRIEILKGGTEGCGIKIREKQSLFHLFSMENPWLESINFVRNNGHCHYDHIVQLGFGGGFLTGWFDIIFPGSTVDIYLPNLDIFDAVLNNICLDEILKINRFNFIYDPTGLNFLKKVYSMYPETGVFIDYNELRAMLGSTDQAENLKKFIYANINNIRRNNSKESDVGSKIWVVANKHL